MNDSVVNSENNNSCICVKDVMTQSVILVNGHDNLQDALQKLSTTEARVLVIDKRHKHDEYGFISLVDIVKKLLAQDKSPARVSVYEVMTKPALCISEMMDVKYCARLFLNFDLQAAPVVNAAGEVTGIVSFDEMVFKGLLKQS